MVDIDKVFFMADPHFRHKNIIKYCNRPFSVDEKGVHEMNETLIKNHNEIVPKDATVYLMGDIGWPDPTEYIKRLNGNKILVKGNHDDTNLVGKLLGTGVISYVCDYTTLDLRKQSGPFIAIMHYPIESWDRKYYGSLHLHGHTHGTLDNSGLLRFDMGVDCNNLRPFSLRQVLDMYDTRVEELGGVEGIRGNIGDKETHGLKEMAKPRVRDSRMQELYNEAEADFDKFLADHMKYKEYYDRSKNQQ